MADANPRCEWCGMPMLVLTGTGRNPFFCAQDCDRLPHPKCPTCTSDKTTPFSYTRYSPTNGIEHNNGQRCIPCGAVFDPNAKE